MQPESILKADVLDILFENRNKAYGAYMLRREYDNRMVKAIIITFCIAALVLLLYSFKTEKKPLDPHMIFEGSTVLPSVKPPKKIVEPPKSLAANPKKTNVKPPASIVIPSKPTIVKDQLADTAIAKVFDIKDKNISNVKSDGPPNNSPQNIDVATGDGKGKKEAVPEGKNIDPSIPISNPDVYPKFPGGEEALKKFLERNLVKPDDAEDGKTASVKIRFVVNPDGTISGFNVMESGGDEFDKEVMRVLKKMPRWIPGKSNGHDVSVYFVVPVKFVNED